MPTHSIGVVGTGVIAETVHLPVLCSMPNVELAWITDRDADRARAVGHAYGLRAVDLPADPGELPPCDAVLLAIPPRVRGPYLRAFAARGTAVMTEKPFAIGSEEHRQKAALFPPHRVGCGYQRRNYAGTLLVRELLREGWFGRPLEIRLCEGGRVRKSNADVSHLDDVRLAGGGVLMSQGCHSVDWLLYVTNARSWEILDSRFVYDGDIDRKASARLRLDGDCGEVEAFHCVSWLDDQSNQIELRFENVSLSLGTGPDARVALRPTGGGEPLAQLLPEGRGATTTNQAFFLEWAQFLEGLETEVPSCMSADAALRTTQVLEALYDQGQPE